MRRRERGVVAVVIAIVLALLLGFLALSLETGHVASAKGELQNGADAAALAGAKRLDGTNKNSALAGAVAEAERYARAHPTDQWDVEPFTVQLGSWTPPALACPPGSSQVGESTPDGDRFCAFAGTAANPAHVNAVRVVTMRSGEAGNAKGGGAVAHPFGAFVGKAQSEIAAEAIAVTGSPANGCPELPFAVKWSCVSDGGLPACDGSSSYVPPIFYVGLGESGIDTAGLTAFRPKACAGEPDTGIVLDEGVKPELCRILNGQCTYEPEVGKCIEIKNGTNVNSKCGAPINDDICGYLRDSKMGSIAQIPLIQWSEDEDCGGGWENFNYNQSARIMRFGSVKLVGAKCKNQPPNTADGYENVMGPCMGSGFANRHCFALEFVCGETDDDESAMGYGWSGTVVQQPILVR